MIAETVFGEGELGAVSRKSLEVLRRYHDAFKNRRPDDLVDLVADDCYIENIAPAPNGTLHQGKQACLAVWQPLIADETKRFEHEEILVVGDRVVTRWRLRWGEGDENSLRGLNMMRIRDGKIVEAFGYSKR
jgi:ketosteroid isomerase-like protein